LTEGLVDFISSDAHDLTRRPPQMDKSFKILAEKYGHGYAERLCRTNAEKLFCREMTAEDI
jgi:tyrosine-protein phosphatase YwqE